jgi:hypothetical protein
MSKQHLRDRDRRCVGAVLRDVHRTVEVDLEDLFHFRFAAVA